MSTFLTQLALAAPQFALVAAGYILLRWLHCPRRAGDLVSKFVFTAAIPAMLFRLMSDLSRLPPVDTRLLLAFFGACLVVFVVGRLIGARRFGLDGTAQSVFAVGGIFSNNVLLGIPLARAAFGEAAMPSVALVLVFNALILWTLVTVSVEWARHGQLSLAGMGNTVRGVATNPIVASIVGGALFGLAGGSLPALVDVPLSWLAQAAAPLALLALGMGLADYGVRSQWAESLSICALKLAVQPFVVWLLAKALALPAMETRVVVLLGALPVGVNVYLMAKQFQRLEAAVASSLVLSTVLSALTVPLLLTLLA